MQTTTQALIAALIVAVSASLVAADVSARGLYGGGFIMPQMPYNNNPKFPVDARGYSQATKNKFMATVIGAGYAGNASTFIAGQELRIMVNTWYLSNVSAITKSVQNKYHTNKMKPYDGLHLDSPGNPIRLSTLLALGNYSLFPAFNISGPSPVRVRVISAGATRSAKLQAPIICGATNHDVWAESWAMAPRNLAWGRQMAFSAFFTITAPPFRWRMCVKDVSNHNATRVTDEGVNSGYAEFVNHEGQWFNFREPLYLWQTPSTSNNEGDFGAIKIVAHSYIGEQLFTGMNFNHTSYSVADDIKLVPTGYPCTYEHLGSRADKSVLMDRTRSDQYCGSNFVHVLTGQWLQTSTCPYEGSVAHGVANVGSVRVNPLATTVTPSGYWINDLSSDLDSLVGYFEFPAAGNYDVCVSTRQYRRAVYNMSSVLVRDSRTSFDANAGSRPSIYPVNSMPVWFKAYAATSSSCTGANEYMYKTTCRPRKAVFPITARHADVNWATTDETPGSWGHVKFTSESGTALNYNAATQWDHSTDRNFYQTASGDQFRLVNVGHFQPNAVSITGDLSGTTVIATAGRGTSETTSTVNKISTTYTTGTLTTAGEGAFKQYILGAPQIGTMSNVNTGSGCWWTGDDNYGIDSLNGNPGTQCCSSAPCTTTNWCKMSESGVNGPSASGDLGGNPRHGYSAWSLDGTGTNAWADVRFPTNGYFRVCYRRAGGNWRVLNGTSAFRPSVYNSSFFSRALNNGFTYHFNDSRAGTWTPLSITANAGTGAIMDTQKWSYFTTTTSPVVGSAVKMVTTAQSCLHATAQTSTYNMNPGAWEGMTLGSGLGSATESSTLVSQVVFFVKMTAYSTSTKYRVCFRNKDSNWYALSDPNYVPHTYMTSATEFAALPTVGISYTLVDTTEGTWGKILLNRSTDATQAFNVEPTIGDLVRIVPNTTSTGDEVFCDMTNGAASTDLVGTAQAYSAALTDSDLAIQCGLQSSVSTSECYTGTLRPTDNSINANYPYEDINALGASTGASKFEAAAAFITLPAQLNANSVLQGYKVCFRSARTKGWIEAIGKDIGGILTMKAKNAVSFSAATTTMYAGSYTYVTLTASGTTKISWSTSLVKLVPSTKTCEAPAASNGGYQLYLGMSGLPSGATSWSTTHCLVDATNSTQITGSCGAGGTSTSVRAYMTLPTLTGPTAQTTSYKVCYMARDATSTTTANWQDLSSSTNLDVYYSGITYTVNQQPYQYSALKVTFKSGGVALDTTSGKDMAKFVTSTVACVDYSSTDQPSAASVSTTFKHQGLEPSTSATGISDLGPTDVYPTRTAVARTVLGTGSYKVCYKPSGKPWMEITEALGSERIVLLNSHNSIITPMASELSTTNSFVISSTIRAQSTQMTTYGGVSYSNLVIGGTSTKIGSSTYFYFSLSSSETTAYADTVKLVRTHTESATSNGTYTYITGTDCFSDGIEFNVSTTVSSTFVLTDTNMPQTPGKYLVCYWRSKTSQWYQGTTSATHSNPFTIIDNLLGFEVVGTTGIRIKDFHQWNGVSLGSLAGADRVHVINGTTSCGNTDSFNNVAYASAEVLNSTNWGIDTTNYAGIRETSVTLTLPVSTVYSGAFTVCYYSSQGSSTNVSTSVAPFRKSGRYFAVRNVGTTYGAGTNYFVASQATKLRLSGCPVTNTSYRLRSGEPFMVTVDAVNDKYERVPYASGVIAHSATATAVSSFTLSNQEGKCMPTNAASYGYTSNALTQFLEDGRATFAITTLSGCPATGCTFNFVSSAATIAASPSCTFYAADTTVMSTLISSSPSAAVATGESFALRIVGLAADGQIAHSSTDSVTIQTTGANSLSAGAVSSTGASFTIASSGSTNFVNGVLDLTITFSATAFSSTASETVKFKATANGKTSPEVTVTVNRPVATAVHVVDIYPDESITGLMPHPMTPGFEPSTSSISVTKPGVFRGDDLVLSDVALSAASGFHLVAGTMYVAKLRVVGTPSGGSARYLTSTSQINTGLKISIDQTTIKAAGNAIFDGSCSNEYCTTEFQQTNFDSTTKSVKFMVNNAKTATSAGIVIPFKFDGGMVGSADTTISAPIRGVANRLQWSCATTLAGLTSASVGTACPASAVNKGWYINVTAVDIYGTKDAYFSGDIHVVMTKASEAKNKPKGVFVTTVSKLSAGSMTAGASGTASAGTAIIPFTVSRACAAGDCMIQVISSWGADVADVGAVTAVSNAASLKCELDKVLAYCDTALPTPGVCNSVKGVSRYNETHADSLMYTDTQICVNVMAVDANGDSTLEATNWVAFYVRPTFGASALTVTDSTGNTDFVKRYKAMSASKARFCFTVGGSVGTRTQFTTTFVAQKFNDANHWTQGSTGRCSLGTLSVWGQKRVGSIEVSSATSAEIVTTGTNAVVAGSITGTTYSFDLGLTVKDHYGNAIGSSVMATETGKYIGVGMTAGAVEVTPVASKSLRGHFNATILTGSVANVTSTVNYKFQVDGACLGCKLWFTVVNNDGTWANSITLGSTLAATQLNATATVYVDNARTTATRSVAFAPSTSPLASYWVNGSTTANLAALTSNSAPTMHRASCSGSTCMPYEGAFNLAKCDSRGTATNMGATSSSTALNLRVMTLDATTELNHNSEPQGILMHPDILNTYTMSISFGNQLLSCQSTGAACGDDNTAAPKQTLAAYGATMKEAITAFHGVGDSSIKATSFHTVGLTTSSYLFVNSTTMKIGSSSLPSVRGGFSASATHVPASGATALTVAGITGPSDFEFFWRSAAEPRTISILATAVNNDPCNDTMTYDCSSSSTSGNCAYTGIAGKSSITNMGFAYASQSIPTGVAFPMTVEVQDANGNRVAGASGSVKISVASFAGCNNGNEAFFTGTVANGRATVMLTFAKPCQSCVLKAVLTPDASQATMYATMNNNPGALETMSAALTVTSTQPTPTELVVTASTPATAITSTATALTVADTVSLTFETRALTGKIPSTQAKKTWVSFYNKAPTSGSNWWWVGYGGALRSTATDKALVHHQTTWTQNTGAGTRNFLFSRTCTACTVTVAYKIDGATSTNSFALPSTFTVTTASTQSTLFGFAPRMVMKGKDLAFAMVYTGSEDSTNIPVAGVATRTAAKTNRASVSLSVKTSGNDVGGALSTTSWGTVNGEFHRVSPAKTCTLCTLTADGNSFDVKITTRATNLFLGLTPATAERTVAIAGSVTFSNVKALDAAGWIDETFGATACAFPWFRGHCPGSSNAASVGGTVGGSFPVNSNSFLMGNPNAMTVQSTSNLVAGVGVINVTYNTPIRHNMPTFTAFKAWPASATNTISSATTSTYKPIQPVHTVSAGKTGLEVGTNMAIAVDKITTNVWFTVDVALLGSPIAGSTNKYVSTEADNAISVTATSCPAFSATTNTTGKLMKGYTRMTFMFTAADTTGACALTFTAGSGAATCTTCSATISALKINALVADSFTVLRPSNYDNSGSGAGLMFGAAGRSTIVTVQLTGATATGGTAAVTDCATCRLAVTMEGAATGTFANCALTATPASASFDSMGRASVSVLFADANVATHQCNVKIAVYSDVALTTAVGASQTNAVTVCKPSKVVMMTNTTATYAGKFLKTGTPYSFYAIVTDSTGAQCRGDSQDEATKLTVDLVSNDAAMTQVTMIESTNINTTDVTTVGFDNGNMAAVAARKTVSAVGGAFNFQMIFADSTVSKGINGVKVRVTASSTTPAITGTSAVAVSGPVDTVVAASRLRFSPMTYLPKSVVSKRAITTRRGTDAETMVVVEAIDGLMPVWGFSHDANVAMKATEFGNDVDAYWKVSPPVAGSFPVSFGSGAQAATLSGGKASWSSVTWNGNDGMYSLSVASQTAGIMESMPYSFMAQEAKSLRVWTKGFTNTAADSCGSACVLPNMTFPSPTSTNAAINGGNAYLTHDSQAPFMIKIITSDSANMPVIGDNSSVIAVALENGAGVSLGVPPQYTTKGTMYARVHMGVAMFNLGMLGGTSNNSVATLKFWCPATRPAALLKPGESTTNPCAALTAVNSMPFTVTDSRPSATDAVWSQPGVLDASGRVKFETGLADPALFNQTRFSELLITELRQRGIEYITRANMRAVSKLLLCGVESTYSAAQFDLSGSVCTTGATCNYLTGNANCPPLVAGCVCPSAARAALLGRYLLQSGSTINASKTAGDLSYDLAKAEGFIARTEADIIAGYTKLVAATIEALKLPAFQNEFQIDAASVTFAKATSVQVKPTFAPTPVPPVPVVPQPPAATPTPTTGATAVQMLFALLAAALMALLA